MDTKVKEKHNLTLTCEVSGNPSHVTPHREALLEKHLVNHR